MWYVIEFGQDNSMWHIHVYTEYHTRNTEYHTRNTEYHTRIY